MNLAYKNILLMISMFSICTNLAVQPEVGNLNNQKLSPSALKHRNFFQTASIVVGSELIALTIQERNFNTKMGTFKTITGALIGVGLVYGSVFKPDAFVGYSPLWEEQPREILLKERLEQRGIITNLLNYFKTR